MVVTYWHIGGILYMYNFMDIDWYLLVISNFPNGSLSKITPRLITNRQVHKLGQAVGPIYLVHHPNVWLITFEFQ